MMRFLLPVLLFAPMFAAPTDSKNDPKIIGSPNALITIEVYSDFQCPHCKLLHFGALKEALGDCVASGKVRLVMRDFPLPQHPYARLAAQYANAAGRIGQYERVCDEIFKQQEVWDKTGDIDGTVAKVLSPADMAKVRKILKDPKGLSEINREIDDDTLLGQKVPLAQTPTMVLSGNGKKYPVAGNVRYDLLKLMIDRMLTK